MRTVDKAVELLGFFSERTPEIGLSDFARRAGFEKATTRRLLLALMKHDYVEQNPETRAYRLGPGVLRLSKVRESAVPIESIVPPLLGKIVERTGETAHFSILASSTITTTHMEDSPHSNRIHFALGEEGPLHATASGLTCLAFGSDDLVNTILGSELQRYSDHTISDPNALEKVLKKIKKDGYYINKENYERGVCSIGAPVLNSAGSAIGAISAAAPSSRFGIAEQKVMKAAVVDAAKHATFAITGREG